MRGHLSLRLFGCCVKPEALPEKPPVVVFEQPVPVALPQKPAAPAVAEAASKRVVRKAPHQRHLLMVKTVRSQPRSDLQAEQDAMVRRIMQEELGRRAALSGQSEEELQKLARKYPALFRWVPEGVGIAEAAAEGFECDLPSMLSIS